MESVNKIRSHCIKIAENVLEVCGDIQCSLEPIGDGLNFLSDAYFVKVSDGKKEISLFAKVPPESNELWKQIFNSYPPDLYPFQSEFCFYKIIRGLFTTLIEDNGESIVDILDIIPKPFITPGQITFDEVLQEPLICEDLSKLGYRMWPDEFNGLDIPHAEVALEAYGKLHALGMLLLEKGDLKSELIDKLFNNFNHATSCMMFEINDAGLKTFQDWMENNNYSKEAIEKVKHELKDRNYVKTCEEMFIGGKSHEMQVFQHYDARSNNMLFNYASDDSTPVGAKLVDFQFSSIFPPFWDLVYFLALCISSDNLIPNYQSLLERYRTSLVSTLRLNYPKAIPTTSYISRNITHFAPMVLPNIAGVTDFCSGAGNPNLDPVQRDNRIRSGVENCTFLGIFSKQG